VVPKILDMIKLKVETSFLKYLQPYIIRYILGGNIDIIFTGGAKLCESTKNFYIKNNILVTEGYGCTETSPIISLNGIDHPSRDVNTAGKILDNLKVTIDNGEICVSGPSVIEGYWNKAPFGNPIYRTGDLGSIDKDNFLTINGRLNDNYKLSNGKFVDVNKTEELIKKHINGFYMVFGRNAQHNSIVSDQNISETDLKVLNKELDNINVIKKAYYLPTEKFLEFTTPKLSIKRNILELYIKNTYE
jgi:acyl-CoA synthetase (AMP-forming)/AMP-acid ligase II